MNGESYNLENLKLHSSIKVMTKFYHPQLQIYRSPCIDILASRREIFRQENLQIMTKQKVIPTHFISSINGTVLMNIIYDDRGSRSFEFDMQRYPPHS